MKSTQNELNDIYFYASSSTMTHINSQTFTLCLKCFIDASIKTNQTLCPI